MASSGAPSPRAITPTQAGGPRALKPWRANTTGAAIQTLVDALKSPKNCVPAAIALLDRGWGKPTQSHDIRHNFLCFHRRRRSDLSSLSRSQAAALLLHRRNIRTSLKTWCIEALSRVDLKPARHHELLIDRLEAIERGDITRLMVLMPPGSAKSTYVSTLFPPWYLARNPDHAVVAASHTSELSERFGRRVRNIINEHAATLNVALAPDIQAAEPVGNNAGR